MAQRYVPEGGSSYYPPRDRSPPRRRDSEYDSFTPRDAPRGPKALNDTARGPGPAGVGASRGRGNSSRGDFRGSDTRERTSSWAPSDRDRWPDRDLDRRERRPSPPRGRPVPTSDFRDARDAPRDPDPARSRRDSRDAPAPGAPYFSDSRGGARGGYRGRGRGDWDVRSRSRPAPYADDRDHFRPPSPRQRGSRSPPPPLALRRYDRDARDDRDADRFDARRRDDAERYGEPDRWRRGDPPTISTADARRPSSTTTPTTPHVSTFASSTPVRPTDHDRDAQRKGSATSTAPAPPSTGVRRAETAKLDGSSYRPEPARASSPPQSTEVPAFGFTPATAAPPRDKQESPWNVWKAPAESKSVLQPAAPAAAAATPLSATPLSSSVKPSTVAAPAAPKVDLEPPKAPKAERAAELMSERKRPQTQSPRLDQTQRLDDTTSTARVSMSYASNKGPDLSPAMISPPTGPRQLTAPPSGPRNVAGPSTSQSYSPRTLSVTKDAQPSPGFQAPTGPRSSASALGINIPTGPKADRAPSSTNVHRGAVAPSHNTSWQWNKSPAAPAFQTSSITPAKRGSDGQEKEKPSFSARPTSSGSNRPSITGGLRREAGRARSEETSTDAAAKIEPANVTAIIEDRLTDTSGRRTTVFAAEKPEEEDVMDLDDDDFESMEAKFEKEKAHLLSKKFDLSQFEFWDETIAEETINLTRILFVENLFKSHEKESAGRVSNGAAVDMADEEAQPLLAEEGQQPMLIKVERSPTPERTPPITTPEIAALPFLSTHDLPMTPLSEQDIYQDNMARLNRISQTVVAAAEAKLSSEYDHQQRLQTQFKELYRPWKAHCAELDREQADKAQDGAEQDEVATVEAVADPVLLAPPSTTERGRRGLGFTSEYDYQLVLKRSEEAAKAEQIKREREELLSKPDYDREAVVPDMLPFAERSSSRFKDTSTARKPAECVIFWELNPPRDDFTQEEHDTMLKNFKEHPKKFGMLANALPDRDYKDCIHHYYATKWSGQYKPPKDKRKRNAKKAARATTGQGKAKASSTLIAGLGSAVEVYDGDEASKPLVTITDRGRPKRAAAPVFGEKLEAEDTSSTAATPAKKTSKDGDDSSATAGGSKRAKSGKDSRSKKTKTQGQPPSMRGRRADSMSPEKGEVESRLKPNLAAPPPSSNPTARDYPMVDMPVRHPIAHPLAAQVPQEGQRPLPPSQGAVQPAPPQARVGTSSYWSVQDVNNFPTLLRHYGADWPKIAADMGTKSATMVKNYYTRHIQQGHLEFQEWADIGDSRAENNAAAPPPVLANAPPQPLRRRTDQVSHANPRPLAPNPSELAEGEEGTPPPQALPRSIPPYQPQASAAYPFSVASQSLSERAAEPRSGLFSSTQPPSMLSRDSRLGYGTEPYRDPIGGSQHGAMQQNAAASGYSPRERDLAYERPAMSGPRPQSWRDQMAEVSRSSFANILSGRPSNVNEYDRRVSVSTQSPSLSQAAPVQGHERAESRPQFHDSVAQEGRDRVENLLSSNRPPLFHGSPRQPPVALDRHDSRDSQRQAMTPSSANRDFERPAPPKSTPMSAQPPKRSNLMSILNDDPPSQPPPSRSHTPPRQGYPPQIPPERPASTMLDRRDPGVERSSQPPYGAPPYMSSSQGRAPDWLMAASREGGLRDAHSRSMQPHHATSASPRLTDLGRPPPRETSHQASNMMPNNSHGSLAEYQHRQGLSAVPGPPFRTSTPPQGMLQHERVHGDRMAHWEHHNNMPPLGSSMYHGRQYSSPHGQPMGLDHSGRSSVPPGPRLQRQDSGPSSFDRARNPEYRSSLANVGMQPSSIPPYYERERVDRERERGREREREREREQQQQRERDKFAYNPSAGRP